MNKMPNTRRPKLTTSDEVFTILCAAIENHFRKLNDIKECLDTYVESEYYKSSLKRK
jgi:hypothetical protein